MIYSGNQIRIKYKEGGELVYRGSAYTVTVDRNTVVIYRNDHVQVCIDAEDIEKVTEGGYSSETIY